ncbi:MAG: histidine kinase [endosymbiont of Seepiophila jonesi]|uniref:Histidine kinase n=1 Tax=endosymbiont of Lamellibrachia luymesi TaxID=2200907 RepID=A0A370DQL3_9GAMM|nr:MAG: histidine kinase [endosymbiont of Lamellibrachia luymesi]RDH89455.1 MAG: histidine kinase [endosymbiont of Seepiophila jonesi]
MRNTGRHPEDQIWAGGDNTLGPNLAVNAIAAGLTAAEGILTSFSLLQRIRRQV